MTTHADFDRRLHERLVERSTTHAPDGLLDSTLARVATTRQRPAWRASERWAPMTALTIRPAPTLRFASVLALLALLALLAIGLALLAGRHPAGNGPIAYVLDDDVYTVGADGHPVDVTSDSAVENGLATSPDGSLVAFWSHGTDGAWSVGVLDVGAGTLRIKPIDPPLTQAPGALVIAPDGRRAAFTTDATAACSSLSLLDLADHPGRVTPMSADGLSATCDPAFSHDGRRVAFIGKDGTRFGVHVLDLASGRIATADGSLPGGLQAWSPDDATLLFSAHPIADEAAPVHLFGVGTDGKGLRAIGDPNRSEFGGRWSPDGTRIAFTVFESAADLSSLWVMDAEGHGAIRVYRGAGAEQYRWAPDGRYLVFQALPDTGPTGETATYGIYRVQPDGDGLTLIATRTAAGGPPEEPVWASQP
jgi:Tol biopolymer transport system component